LATLAQFIDAAPEVREALQTENVTLLAPTNTAFENLASALNTPLSELIGSVEIVTALINYHTLDGVVSDSTLRTRAGQVIPTRLTNAFVGISINAENQIVVNNVVEITTADIGASNGRVHILNDVLLNRVIDNLIDDLNFTDLIVPNVSSTPTATPVATATSTPQTARGSLRFAHLASDIDRLTVRVEGETLADNIRFGSVTDFEMRRQGIYTIEILSEDNRTLLERDVTLLNNDTLTLAVLGSLGNNTLNLVTFAEDFTPFDTDERDDSARLTVIHAIEDAPSVDVYISDALEIEDLAFTGFDIIDIAIPDDTDNEDAEEDEENSAPTLLITESGDEEDILFAENGNLFAPASYHLVLLYGTEDDAELAIITLSEADLADEEASEEEATQEADVDDNNEATATATTPILVTNTPRPTATPVPTDDSDEDEENSDD
ncbi:MAG: DUF4397 domain-containing protein, partial [Chloroflexota bacterium]